MTLNEQINADFITAFKAKETQKKTLLGVIKGEIQNKAPNPTDENVLAILKATKKALEQSLAFGDDSAELELSYIEGYFPALMSETQIREAIQLIIVNSGETNMGKVMGMFNKEYSGKADNKLVSQIVKEELV
jgi:uncharacterized protein YqeY